MISVSLRASQYETPVRRDERAPAQGADACSKEAHAPATALDLDMTTTQEAFALLEADWSTLFDRCAHSAQLFQRHSWLRAWCHHFLDHTPTRNMELAVVTGRRNGRLVLVLPLVRSSRLGITRLSFMGEPVSQYGDILVDAGAVGLADIEAAFFHAVRTTRADLIAVRKVRADAAIAPLLHKIGARLTETQIAPHLSFEGCSSYASWEQRYSASARRNRRRQLRRLQDMGRVTFERLPPGEEARHTIREAIALKRAWLSERGLVSKALSDPRTEAFFCACAQDRDGRGEVDVARVRVGEETAAIEVTLAAKGRRAVHIIVYNPKYEKAAAGALLMEDSIRHACETGMETFDLLAPGDRYKLDWASDSIEVHDWTFTPTMRGTFAARASAGMRTCAKTMLALAPTTIKRSLATRMSLLAIGMI